MRANPAERNILGTPTFLQDHDAAADTYAECSWVPDADQYSVIEWVAWSYSDVPSGGRLIVAIEATTYVDIDITAAGPGMLRFDPPIYNPLFTKEESCQVKLFAGGGTCVGKLSVRYR